MIPTIQNGLNSFQNWCNNNCLKLNVRKSKYIVIGTKHKLSGINTVDRFKFDNLELQHVDLYNNLGIVFDSQMSLSPLFSKVNKRVTDKIYMLLKIRNNIDTQCAIAIYKQTILTLLDYAGFMLISGNISDRSDYRMML